MDEKTEQLRDLFMEVAEEATVTEQQTDERGSLTTDGPTEERVRRVIERLRDRYEFRSELEIDALLHVVEGWYENEDPSEIADGLGQTVEEEAVTRAAVDLHLVDLDTLDASVELDRVRDALAADRSIDAIAEELEIPEQRLTHYQHVLEVTDERRVVGDRYREEFDRLLADRDLGEQLTEDIQESGLDGATEGLETNTSF